MKTSVKHLLVAMTLSTSFAIHAQEDEFADAINVAGYVSEPAVTDQELETVNNELRKQKNAIIINKEKAKKYNQLGRSTEKLADATEDLIDERKESQATIDRYNRKIKCLMEQAPGADCDEFIKGRTDKVQVSQAAPEQHTVVENSSLSPLGAIKVLPYSGLTSYQSANEALEATISAGVRVESDVTQFLSIGLGFKYNSFTTNDFGGRYNNIQYYNFYGNQGRQVDYTNLNFDISGKFYITKNDRFRPYIGAGLGYNRSSIDYAEQQQQIFSNLGQFGNEELTTSYVNANILVGSEVVFTKSFGANLEFGYSRGLGDSFNSQNSNILSPDQQRLIDLNQELIDANIFSINVGMIVYF